MSVGTQGQVLIGLDLRIVVVRSVQLHDDYRRDAFFGFRYVEDADLFPRKVGVRVGKLDLLGVCWMFEIHGIQLARVGVLGEWKECGCSDEGLQAGSNVFLDLDTLP